MENRNKGVLFFLFIIVIFFTIHAAKIYSSNDVFKDQKNIVYFLLLNGNAYKSPAFVSKRVGEIKFKFGDIIKYQSKEYKDGYIWYRCAIANKVIFLPAAFVDEKIYSEYQFDNNGNIEIGSARIDKVYGIPLNYIPTDLSKLDKKIKARGYEWRDLKLRIEAKRMFERMIQDAKASGVNIFVISAFRDAKYQSKLYTRAIKRNGIKENSVAKPGHSEHQLGTACDLTSDEINYALSEDFKNTAAYTWLIQNSWRYGIFLTYPSLKQRVTGYVYEPWHFRYWGKKRWEKLFSKYKIRLR